MVTRAQQQLLRAGAMKETGRNGLDANIKDTADRLGIIAVHHPDSRRVTDNGWPDWVLMGTRGTLFVEGKSRGRTRSPEQIEVARRLAIQGITVHVWYPEHWLDGTAPRMMQEIA